MGAVWLAQGNIYWMCCLASKAQMAHKFRFFYFLKIKASIKNKTNVTHALFLPLIFLFSVKKKFRKKTKMSQFYSFTQTATWHSSIKNETGLLQYKKCDWARLNLATFFSRVNLFGPNQNFAEGVNAYLTCLYFQVALDKKLARALDQNIDIVLICRSIFGFKVFAKKLLRAEKKLFFLSISVLF